MKVYVDSEDIDVIEDLFQATNSYECWAGNCGDNLEIISLSDYTKQVRKKMAEEIRDIVKQIARPTTEYDDGTFDYDIDAVELDHLLIWLKNGEMDLIKHHLDQIQGETK